MEIKQPKFKEEVLADGTRIQLEVEEKPEPDYVLKIKTDTGRMGNPIKVWGNKYSVNYTKGGKGFMLNFKDPETNTFYKKWRPSDYQILRFEKKDNPFIIDGKFVEEVNKKTKELNKYFKIQGMGNEVRKVTKL